MRVLWATATALSVSLQLATAQSPNHYRQFRTAARLVPPKS